MTTSQTATADTHDFSAKHERRHGCRKRGWSGAEIATIIGGFVVFPPFAGLLFLGLKLFRGEIWTGSSENIAPWTAFANWKNSNSTGFASRDWPSKWSSAGSGNAAFDAYKKEQLQRLEAERRKLDEEQKAFAEHLAKLRMAKDQDEFDRFMAERSAPPKSE